MGFSIELKSISGGLQIGEQTSCLFKERFSLYLKKSTRRMGMNNI